MQFLSRHVELEGNVDFKVEVFVISTCDDICAILQMCYKRCFTEAHRCAIQDSLCTYEELGRKRRRGGWGSVRCVCIICMGLGLE